jgi:hypothetical protein
MPQKLYIFLSYSPEDRPIARHIARDLEARGNQVWFDEKEILAGDSITDRITEALLQCDYLLVLISRHSVDSSWVKLELDAVFARHAMGVELPVIPIRLDDTELPKHLRSLAYIDFYASYEDGFDELQRRIERGHRSTTKVDEIVDVPSLAKDLGAGKKVPRGAEFYVTTVIGIMTLLATVIGVIPAVMGMVGNRPRVYYTEAHYGLIVPPGPQGEEIQKLVADKGLADSTLQFALINKGDAKANDVEIGVQINGTMISVITEPPAGSNPVWVQISVAPLGSNVRGGRVSLHDLIPGKNVTVSIQYHSSKPEYTADVVADGHLATKVTDLAAVPTWSPFQAFKLPLEVFAAGLAFSLLAGFGVAVFRNPRLRSQATEVLESVSPISGALIRKLATLAAKEP